MNILDYIDHLIDQGYTEEQAEICADALFCIPLESDDIDYDYTTDDYYGE